GPGVRAHSLEVHRDPRLVADDPRGMPGRNLKDITRPDLELGPVAHLRSEAAADRDTEVVKLARVGLGDWLDVDRPSPSRFVRHAADHPVIELDDVDPAVRDRPDVIRVRKAASLQSCDGPARAVSAWAQLTSSSKLTGTFRSSVSPTGEASRAALSSATCAGVAPPFVLRWTV